MLRLLLLSSSFLLHYSSSVFLAEALCKAQEENVEINATLQQTIHDLDSL